MPADAPLSEENRALHERLALLEARIARLEALAQPPVAPAASRKPDIPAVQTADERSGADFELEVGQNWFARVGILALAAGGAFLLAQPFPNLPAGIPSVAGFVFAALLLAVAHWGQRSFELVASQVRGAAMALLVFAALRLFYFGAHPALGLETLAGRAVLAGIAALNFAIAIRHGSPRLFVLALLGAATLAVATGTARVVLPATAMLAALVTWVCIRHRWPAVTWAGIVATTGMYVTWALDFPARGGAWHVATGPLVAPEFLLLNAVLLAFGALARSGAADDDEVSSGAIALFNGAATYAVFLLHTAKAFAPQFALLHTVAFVVFLGLAVLFWTQQRSRASTFFYAMTGYLALSFAIIKIAAVPDVFVWLALQCVLVIATAIWFRSRFIIVANFLIYVAIVLAYMAFQQRETGISIGFGVVALVSARVLNWQKHRLELKTELMRNAYLASAFAIFPYALAHLVAAKYIALAWVGLALAYYALNVLFQNQKYRWMGHGTLLLTTVYVATVGSRQFEPVYRVLSFLALGSALLIVSLTLTRRRQRAAAAKTEPAGK
jgi:hypothetical protein